MGLPFGWVPHGDHPAPAPLLLPALSPRPVTSLCTGCPPSTLMLAPQPGRSLGGQKGCLLILLRAARAAHVPERVPAPPWAEASPISPVLLCSDHTASLSLLKPSKLSALTFPRRLSALQAPWAPPLGSRPWAVRLSVPTPLPGVALPAIPSPAPLSPWTWMLPAFPCPALCRRRQSPSYTSQVTEQQSQPGPSGQPAPG